MQDKTFDEDKWEELVDQYYNNPKEFNKRLNKTCRVNELQHCK